MNRNEFRSNARRLGNMFGDALIALAEASAEVERAKAEYSTSPTELIITVTDIFGQETKVKTFAYDKAFARSYLEYARQMKRSMLFSSNVVFELVNANGRTVAMVSKSTVPSEWVF